jgi:type IV pilus assembly protein PilE
MFNVDDPAKEAGGGSLCLNLRERAICTLPRGRRLRSAARLRRRGFSLAELLVTLVIVALLVAIAYPSYTSYKVRANRAAAQAFLIDLANRQQLHFLDARRFSTDLVALGASPPPSSVAPYYAIADPVVDNTASPPTFLLSAVARPGTVQARDGDLSIDSVGRRAGHW